MKRRGAAVLGIGLAALLAPGCFLRQQTPDAPVERSSPVQTAELAPVEEKTPAPPPPPAEPEKKPVALPVSDLKPVSAQATPAVRAAAPQEPPAPEPAAPEPAVVAAVRLALEGRAGDARKALEKYGPADRDVLVALVRLTAGLGGGKEGKMPAAEVAAAAGQLEALAARLRGPAPLRIECVRFCRRIDGFGQFEPLPPSHEFQPGSEGRPGDLVRVYTELRNFTSRPAAGGYETTLATAVDVFDLQQRKVVSLNLGSCVDRCQSRRQDYFLNAQFHVPARLPAGLYTVRVTVHDLTPGPGAATAGRVASRTLDLRVGPTPPGAPQP